MASVAEKLPGIKTSFKKDFHVPVGQNTFDIEEFLSSQEKSSRHGNFSMGNAESLAFKDNSFDAYVANLCLMIVDNHKNQLKECLRVLKPGSSAAFAVWGRPERAANFTMFDSCVKELGVEF